MRTTLLLTLAMLGFTFAVHTIDAAELSEFSDFSMEGLPGRLYVPPEAKDSRCPVILFLHGAGETGDDNARQVNHNIDNLLKAAKKRGAYLYAPQAVERGWGGKDRTDKVIAQLDAISAKQNGDAARIYITGISMGGGGTWTMASRYPGRFAAAMPICGAPPADDWTAASALKTPTWAFHARDDKAVPFALTRERIDAMLASADLPPVEIPKDDTKDFYFENDGLDLDYTEYAEGGHNIWTRAYSTPSAYEWMFSHEPDGP